jgi:hypothetical protein
MAKLYLGSNLISGGGGSTEVTVTPSASSVDEGGTVTFTIATAPAQAAAQVLWGLTGVSASDVVGGALFGVATTNESGVATVAVEIVADGLTEAAETLTLLVGMESGSAAVTVNDTSISPLVLLHFTGNNAATASTDSSPNNFTVNHFAPLSNTAPLQFGPTHLSLNGTSQYVQTNTSALLSLPGAFCIDCWVYATSSTGHRPIFELGLFSDGVLLRAGDTDGSLYVNNTIVGGAGAVHSSLAYNQWVHTAVTRDASNNVRLFIGGTQIGSAVTVAGTVNNANSRLRVGAALHVSTQFFAGRIDEFRIVKGQPEWVSNFTPPSAPYLP